MSFLNSENILGNSPLALLDRDFGGFLSEVLGDINDNTYVAKRGINIEDLPDKVLISYEIPGVKQEDLDVSLENKILTISGEKKKDFEEKEGDCRYVGRSYGSFRKSIKLNSDIDAEKVLASITDGVLRIELPKLVNSNKAKKIKIL